jgi:hypothetical protein
MQRAAVAALLAVTANAYATIIEYDVLDLGGSNYRSTYTVINDGSLGPGVPITLFDIEFDPSLYLESSLTITTPAALQAQWDELIFPSVPGLPAVYDVFALGGGVAHGASVSGFSIEFQWLGSGLPGSQLFQIYDVDPVTGATTLLETGLTRARAIPMPEPQTSWLLMLGAVGILGAAGRRAGRAGEKV